MPAGDVLWPIASSLLIYLARILELNTKRPVVAGRVFEEISLKLFILSGTILIIGGIIELFLTAKIFSWLAFGVGWVLALASFAVRRKAIKDLGKFWSLHVEIRSQHEFVRSGAFRWLRHPTYFSMLLEVAGIALILNSRWSVLISLLLFIPTLIYRIRLEESALLDQFGDSYRAYQGTTPAILPYKFPR